jgi:hypothetical protein
MKILTAVAVTVFALMITHAAPPASPHSPLVNATKSDDETVALCRKLFSLIDLARPGLEAVRQKVEAGDLMAAMLEYRTALAARVAKQPRNGRFGYSLWQPASADELLEGNATTIRYGDFNTKHTVHIGKPGEINFFAALPEYRDVGRDISNFAWVNKYAEAYGKTRDPKYLAGWCATWMDFTEHWPAQWSERQKTNPDEIPSLGWIKGPLMIGMRLYAMQAGFVSVLQTASDAGHLDQLDPRALAGIIVRIGSADMGAGLYWLPRAGGNQVRSLAAAVLEWGILLPEMKDSRKWRDEAIPANISTCLLDGTDKEQSLNYFNNGIGPLLNLVRKRIPAEDQSPELIAKLEIMNTNRGRVIPSLVRPDGFIPGTGTDPVWDKYGKTAKLTPPSTAFTSVVFPYGGYAVQRDGWKPDSLFLFMKQTRPNWGHWRAIDGALQLSAYGRNLLVSPMGQVYDKRDSSGGWTTYWGSAVSQNAIVVDGMSSNERSGNFDKLDAWRWHSSARFDFMETDVIGPYKGNDFRVDGLSLSEWKQRKEWQPPVGITDVTHRRQVHFLREAGCWIVTDRIHSKQPHDFTQSWCLGPEFADKEVEVSLAAKTIRTTQEKGPNLSLYQFGMTDLRYERYFGVRNDKNILGWVGILADKDKWIYTPAVNIHANWRSEGDRVLVTLMTPRPDAKERVTGVTDKSTGNVSGFDAVLPDGRPVSYRAVEKHAALEVVGVRADAESVLVVSEANGRLTGIVLGERMPDGKPTAQPDYEFEIQTPGAAAKITAITIPTGFHWAGEAKQLAPSYSSTARK